MKKDSLDGLIKRSEAVAFTQMSRSGLRYLEGVELTPVVQGRTVYYKREELERVMLERSGESSRKAFAIFESGGGPLDVVAKFDMSHVLAERLWEAWLRLKDRTGRTLIIELPFNINTVPWMKTYGFDPEHGLPGLWALRAIELVAMTPTARARIDRMTGLSKSDGEDDDER